MSEILTVEQVADLLKCDTTTAAERIKSGELPGVKFGRSWIIPKPAFDQRINELAVEQAEARRKATPEPTPEAEPRKKRGRPRFTPS